MNLEYIIFPIVSSEIFVTETNSSDGGPRKTTYNYSDAKPIRSTWYIHVTVTPRGVEESLDHNSFKKTVNSMWWPSAELSDLRKLGHGMHLEHKLCFLICSGMFESQTQSGSLLDKINTLWAFCQKTKKTPFWSKYEVDEILE